MTIVSSDTAKLKFGVGQLQNPTPQFVNYIQRGFLYLSMLWAFLAPTLTSIPPNILSEINMWLLRGNGILSITSKFFGWDFTPPTNDSK